MIRDFDTVELILRYQDAEDFMLESNQIEGILEVTEAEIKAFIKFMDLKKPSIEDLVEFVAVCQPDAKLRNKTSIPNVRVGNHIAPASGPTIEKCLKALLEDALDSNKCPPWETHIVYEKLHPFTDGNGRSGRMLWAWQMGWKGLSLGFLHKFYYQTLSSTNM